MSLKTLNSIKLFIGKIKTTCNLAMYSDHKNYERGPNFLFNLILI